MLLNQHDYHFASLLVPFCVAGFDSARSMTDVIEGNHKFMPAGVAGIVSGSTDSPPCRSDDAKGDYARREMVVAICCPFGS